MDLFAYHNDSLQFVTQKGKISIETRKRYENPVQFSFEMEGRDTLQLLFKVNNRFSKKKRTIDPYIWTYDHDAPSIITFESNRYFVQTLSLCFLAVGSFIFIYSILHFFLLGNFAYLSYSGYVLSLLFYSWRDAEIAGDLIVYLSYYPKLLYSTESLSTVVPNILYFKFLQHYFELKQHATNLFNQMKQVITISWVYVIVDFIFLWLFEEFMLQIQIQFAMRSLLYLFTVYVFISIMIKIDNKLKYFILIGSLILLLAVVADSTLYILQTELFIPISNFTSFAVLTGGATIELLCFSLALACQNAK